MDCDEKQSLIVVLLSICGLLIIVLIVVLYFIWRAGVKSSSRSQSREDATCVTRVEIQEWDGPNDGHTYESVKEDEGTDYESVRSLS